MAALAYTYIKVSLNLEIETALYDWSTRVDFRRNFILAGRILVTTIFLRFKLQVRLIKI